MPIIVRRDSRLREAASFGQSIVDYAPGSTGSEDYGAWGCGRSKTCRPSRSRSSMVPQTPKRTNSRTCWSRRGSAALSASVVSSHPGTANGNTGEPPHEIKSLLCAEDVARRACRTSCAASPWARRPAKRTSPLKPRAPSPRPRRSPLRRPRTSPRPRPPRRHRGSTSPRRSSRQHPAPSPRSAPRSQTSSSRRSRRTQSLSPLAPQFLAFVDDVPPGPRRPCVHQPGHAAVAGRHRNQPRHPLCAADALRPLGRRRGNVQQLVAHHPHAAPNAAPGFELCLRLPKGKHTYRLVIDGHWTALTGTTTRP